MHETVSIPLVDLLLDTGNPRLSEAQGSQQAVYLQLAKQQGRRLLALARDIVENGLDPITLPAVIATSDRRRRYVVMEGNRRVLALKALETPSIVSGALSAAEQKTLADLSVRYHRDPVDEVLCVLFDDRDDLDHWVKLRHTGANEGAGLVTWESDERDRYLARQGTGHVRSLGGQALDFLRRIDGGDPTGGQRIVTNVDRLMRDATFRRAVGLERDGNELLATQPAEEIAKALRRIVSDLTTKQIKVKDIYDAADKAEYLKTFNKADLPDPRRSLGEPTPLADLQPSGKRPRKRSTKPKPKPPTPTQRTTLIPPTAKLNPQPPRINEIYNELLQLNVSQYPNATAVLLRVFVELSIEHYRDQHGVVVKDSANLAAKLKAVGEHLHAGGKIPEQLKKAVDRVANTTQTVLAASTVTWNQYVHNAFTFAKPQELFAQWDELQPFMEAIWK